MEVEEASHSTHVNTRGLARLECLHPLQGGERRLHSGITQILASTTLPLAATASLCIPPLPHKQPPRLRARASHTLSRLQTSIHYTLGPR